MRRRTTGLMILGLLPFLGGCAGTSQTTQGAGIGALLGTGTGALLGSATGHTGTGALLGLGAGTIIGGAIGNEEDRREKNALIQAKNEAEVRAAQQGTRLGLTDVIQLSRQNLGDEVIINQIRSTHSTFQLSTEDLRSLKENGVSDRVVVEMQNARPERPETVVVPRYVPYYARPRYYYGPGPYYYYGPPPPPPPPAVGVGFVIR
ncbi:glycine zipper domain-containing protein [Zavarzinella formosa]|uniref:glycine zipper domain-containing protein n=1 Tax=Zavarzinella formosa TaxID=360055 RepID=UPI0002E2D828|nr:glycine zipper domain-containing protein [Zavarzinella formosa]